MLTRRAWLGSTLVAAAQQPPNVLLFLTDQETALLPGPVQTPHRDALKKTGVDFSLAFCNTPQCSPARASILSGLYPHKAGILTNVDGSSQGKGLKTSLTTVGKVFHDAGYETGYFGKWHLGGGQSLGEFGFDVYEGRGSDEAIASQAAQWVGARKKPWFAIVSILNPHHIYEIPREVDKTAVRTGVRKPFSDLRNLDGKPAEQMQYVEKDQGSQTRKFTESDWLKYRSFYCSLVEKADACFGTVMGRVSMSNTVVAYSTDHGDQIGEHGLPYKGPFMYEELLRIPLTIAGPGTDVLVSKRHEFVMQADYGPTLAGLAGLRWPTATDGVDLTKPAPPRAHLFLEYYAKQKWTNPIRTVRTKRFKLNWYDSGNRELYDLQTDPRELRNLANDAAYAVRKRELEAMLTSWRGPISNSSSTPAK